jgi:amino acid adenylation domain-containing protein
MSSTQTKHHTLPPEQQEIRDKCFHPSGTFVEFPMEDVETSIAERFEKIAGKYPHRIAVKVENRVVTYGELNAMANRVARAMIADKQTSTEPIALFITHAPSLIAAMIAVLKAGKFFVLLNPSFPMARLANILKVSQANLVLADKQNAVLSRELAKSDMLLELESVDEDIPSDNLTLHISPQLPAYIAYTSGSTGQPKGVVQNHRNVLHDTKLRTDTYHLCELDRLSLLASSTSVAVKTAFFALLNGAALFPCDIREQGTACLADWLIREKITICQISAPLFRSLVENVAQGERFPDVRLIQFAGGMRYRTDVDLWKKHFSPNCILANSFSSTETGFICSYVIDYGTEISTEEIPVGYGVSSKEVFLVDEMNKPVANGTIGEIAVRSNYLSPGYWRSPDLTTAKFMGEPADEAVRVFHTGDLGLMLPDGCLVYKGRKDDRWKIRGYTVEPAEIEAALLGHANVKEVRTIAWEQTFGEKCIAAYVVPRNNPAPKVDELRNLLRQKVPDYMVPSAFIFLESLPLINGKLDRGALPKPDGRRPELTDPYLAPRDDIERKLSQIWSTILVIDEIGVHDNFFDLGGHSLAASRVISSVIQTFQVDLSVKALFDTPTVAEMAAMIMECQKRRLGDKELERMLNEVETMTEEAVKIQLTQDAK